MAHTYIQDLEAHFNTLSSNLSMAQKELRQINANISTINSTIDVKMESMKQDMTKDLSYHMKIQLESFVIHLFTKLNILGGLPSFNQTLYSEGDTSSTSCPFQSNHL
jgi:hypothetical protein